MPGRAILADDPLSPGKLGFDEWVSADNFFDLDPVLGRNGVPEKFHGDSSDITTDEALKFIRRQAGAGKPFLAVVWFGSPHVPHQALPADKAAYSALPEKDQNYYGEITAVDRSVGRLRAALRELKVADNTLLWYCSDNGGAAGPKSTGNLRGIERHALGRRPARARHRRVARAHPQAVRRARCPVPRSTFTRPSSKPPARWRKNQIQPLDGISLLPLFDRQDRARVQGDSLLEPRAAANPATPRCWTGLTSCTRNAVEGRDKKGEESRRSAPGAALRRFQRPEGNHRPRRAATGARGENDRRA